MEKAIFKYTEKLFSAVLSTFTCLGMFLMGNFIRNLIMDTQVSIEEMFIIAFASMFLTRLLNSFVDELRFALLEIEVEEMEQEKALKKSVEEVEKIIEKGMQEEAEWKQHGC